jgi:membrane protein DedA with SNARE-associated domain
MGCLWRGRLDMDTLFTQESPYAGLILILILGTLGLPFPEDAILVSAGALVANQIIEAVPAFVVVGCTLLMTDLFLYSMGRKYGRRMVDHKTFQKRISPERLSQLERAFGRWGSLVVFFGRLLPGLRAQIFLVAGTLRMNRALFFVTDAISASVNMCLWGGIGYVGATNITTLRTHMSRIELFVFLVLLATIGGGLFLKYCRKSRKSV